MKFLTIDDAEEGTVPRWWLHRIVEDKRHPWRHYRMFVNDRMDHQPGGHARSIEGSAEWNLFPRHGFGTGFTVKTNGDESHLAISLYAGRIGSLWLRFRSPWTRWFKVERKGENDRDWYKARLYGIRLLPHDGCLFLIECGAREHEHSRNQPWWWEIKLTTRQVMGRITTETIIEDSGECVIPMPEGAYPATWELSRYERRHVRWPGTWLDRVKDRSTGPLYRIKEVPGGIPHEGKGENSYDCGMDGTFGISGPFTTLEQAIGAMVEHSLKDRRRYGGPHDLPEPMTVTQAEEWTLAQR